MNIMKYKELLTDITVRRLLNDHRINCCEFFIVYVAANAFAWKFHVYVT